MLKKKVNVLLAIASGRPHLICYCMPSPLLLEERYSPLEIEKTIFVYMEQTTLPRLVFFPNTHPTFYSG